MVGSISILRRLTGPMSPTVGPPLRCMKMLDGRLCLLILGSGVLATGLPTPPWLPSHSLDLRRCAPCRHESHATFLFTAPRSCHAVRRGLSKRLCGCTFHGWPNGRRSSSPSGTRPAPDHCEHLRHQGRWPGPACRYPPRHARSFPLTSFRSALISVLLMWSVLNYRQSDSMRRRRIAWRTCRT